MAKGKRTSKPKRKVFKGKRGGRYVLDRVGKGRNKGKVRRRYL